MCPGLLGSKKRPHFARRYRGKQAVCSPNAARDSGMHLASSLLSHHQPLCACNKVGSTSFRPTRKADLLLSQHRTCATLARADGRSTLVTRTRRCVAKQERLRLMQPTGCLGLFLRPLLVVLLVAQTVRWLQLKVIPNAEKEDSSPGF